MGFFSIHYLNQELSDRLLSPFNAITNHRYHLSLYH